MLRFANSALRRQNGFVGPANCFVGAVPTKHCGWNECHFNDLGERPKRRRRCHLPRTYQPRRAGPGGGFFTYLCVKRWQQGEDADHGTWRHRRRRNIAAAGPCAGRRRAGGPPACPLRCNDAAGLQPWLAINTTTIHSPGRRLPPASAGSESGAHWMKSPHFCTSLSAAPQGMMGTVDVEFFGEPSISLSE